MIVDLFAGLGGWDYGLAMLGRHDVVGYELDEHACASRAAGGLATVRADISQVPLGPLEGRVEGLIASPPCQTFSNAGSGEGVTHLEALVGFIRSLEADGWREPPDDAPWDHVKTGLVLEPLRWVWGTRPEWVACEQVPPVLPIWKATARCLAAWGYSTWCGVLSSEQFGVPQTRKRAILMAHASRPIAPPEPTHQEYEPGVPARGEVTLFGELLPWVSMAEALGWGMNARPYLTVVAGKAEESFLASNPARQTVLNERSAGRWRVGFGRLADTPSNAATGVVTIDGIDYRDRDFRNGDEPSHAVTGKARSWTVTDEELELTVSTGGNTGYIEREDGTRDYAAFERPITDPAPTIDAKAPGAWKVGEPGHRDDPEARPGKANVGRATSEPPEGAEFGGMFEIRPNGAHRDADEPAMTIPGAADNGNYRFAVNTGRDWVQGGTRADAQVVADTEPAPTVDGTGRWLVDRQPSEAPNEFSGDDWPERRPATTLAGDPRVFTPGGHTAHDGRDNERMNGRSEAAVRITVADALVLQSFAPDTPVRGTKTARFLQVGNAVPPLLARAVLEVLL